MHIPPEALDQFITIFERDFGYTPSREEAGMAAQRLLAVLRLIASSSDSVN